MKILSKLLRPSGNVHKLYNQFIGWSFVSNVIMSTEIAMSTHSMLHAIDNGDEIDRTINYVGKDIIGQIGSLAYMANIGKSVDKNPRKFLLYANIIQQFGVLSISATPLFPTYFLPIAGVSNIFSNLACVGYGSINAKCISTLVTDNNLCEIYAKICIVNTIGSSIGMLIGLGITLIFPSHEERLCILPILMYLRLYTFYKAIDQLIY